VVMRALERRRTIIPSRERKKDGGVDVDMNESSSASVNVIRKGNNVEGVTTTLELPYLIKYLSLVLHNVVSSPIFLLNPS
jgi:hypothetical protein